MDVVSLRLLDDVLRRLEDLAQLTGRSKTSYMIEAICEHLDDLEDLYIAEKRWAEVTAGRSQPVPLEDVMKRFNIEEI